MKNIGSQMGQTKKIKKKGIHLARV